MVKRIQRAEPSTEPVTLAEARAHLRLDTFGSPPAHPEDDLISLYISAARQFCEDYLGHSIAYRTSVIYFDRLKDGFIDLDEWPVSSIDLFEYVDSTGANQTLSASSYILDSASAPARVYSVGDWPSVKTSVPNVATLTVTAGYTDGQSPNPHPISKSIKNAILLMVGHLYENRQQVGQKMDSLPYGVEDLLNLHRTNRGL